MPSTHTYGFISNTFVGITLFVSTQGCGRPQEADGQMVDTHVFCCVVAKTIKNRLNLGVIGHSCWQGRKDEKRH